MFEKEYELEFFKEKGYVRKICKKCATGFWTLDDSTTVCGDTPCVEYSFIGNSPMNRAYSLDEVRSLYIKFFEERGHTKFDHYPVIARWRDDVFNKRLDLRLSALRYIRCNTAALQSLGHVPALHKDD